MTPKEERPVAARAVHVHVCISCGKVSRRDDPDGVPDSTGVFRCTKCGLEGPLNVHVIEASDPRLGH
jgi:hypothetical protein